MKTEGETAAVTKELRVRPGDLEQAGHTAQQTARQIPEETKGVLSGSDQAEPGLRGWQTSRSLHDCTNAWKTLLDKLAAEIDRAGANLITTAGNYRSSDHETKRAVTTAAQPPAFLPPPRTPGQSGGPSGGFTPPPQPGAATVSNDGRGR